jgi:hypothetical protein
VAPEAGVVPVTQEARAQQGMAPLEAVEKSKTKT